MDWLKSLAMAQRVAGLNPKGFPATLKISLSLRR